MAINLDSLDWSRCRYRPFDHQIIGVRALIKNKVFAILDEMGSGKTKTIIDAACFLYEAKEIDTVLIISPAQVKDVWAHPGYSQIVEHSFVKGIITEFNSKTTEFPSKNKGLLWIVVSVELLRQEKHVAFLLRLLKERKFWCIVDESSTISNHKASQTYGVFTVAPKASRRTILNGSPIGQSPLGLWAQFAFLDKAILGFKTFYAFRNAHAVMGGYLNKQVTQFQHIELLQNKIKPYALRRLKKDCLDILPKMRQPLIEVKLKENTWEKYVQMREEFVTYVGSYDNASVVSAAPIKALRLAQICSGFLGGVINSEDETSEPITVEVGCELTQKFLDNLAFRLESEPNYKLIVWCRFRPEIARLEKMMKNNFPKMTVKVLQGGMSRIEKDEAKTMFHPDAPDIIGPATLIGQPQAGRFGSNFTKCSNVDYLSNDYSILTRSQSEDRVHRPGQTQQTWFQDYVVVGPNRERTISGIILKALRQGEQMSEWVCSKWVDEIMQKESDDIPF